jgi:hypothetical protein
MDQELVGGKEETPRLLSVLNKVVEESGLLDRLSPKDKNTCEILMERFIAGKYAFSPTGISEFLDCVQGEQERVWASVLMGVMESVTESHDAQAAFHRVAVEQNLFPGDNTPEFTGMLWEIARESIKDSWSHPAIKDKRSFYESTIAPYVKPYLTRFFESSL